MIVNAKEKQQTIETVYYSAYVLFIIKNMLDVTKLFKRPEIVDTVLIGLFLALISYKLMHQVYSRIGLIAVILLSLLYLYSSITVDYFAMFSSFLCVIALQSIDIKKLLKLSINVKAVFIISHVVIYSVLLVANGSQINLVYRGNEVRHSFFIGHPNMFMAYLVWTLLEIIYINYERLKIVHLMIIWLINFAFYLFTDSNTGTVVLSLTIILIVLEQQKIEWFNSGIGFFSKYLFMIHSILFSVIVMSYTRLNRGLLNIWHWLDHVLTGRLLYGAYAYDVYGYTLLPRAIRFPSKSHWRGHWLDTIFFDNSYIWLFISFGIIHLVLFSVIFVLIGNRTTSPEKIMIIAFTLFAIMEAYVVNVIICFPLLIIGKVIYGSNSTVKCSEFQLKRKFGFKANYHNKSKWPMA